MLFGSSCSDFCVAFFSCKICRNSTQQPPSNNQQTATTSISALKSGDKSDIRNNGNNFDLSAINSRSPSQSSTSPIETAKQNQNNNINNSNNFANVDSQTRTNTNTSHQTDNSHTNSTLGITNPHIPLPNNESNASMLSVPGSIKKSTSNSNLHVTFDQKTKPQQTPNKITNNKHQTKFLPHYLENPNHRLDVTAVSTALQQHLNFNTQNINQNINYNNNNHENSHDLTVPLNSVNSNISAQTINSDRQQQDEYKGYTLYQIIDKLNKEEIERQEIEHPDDKTVTLSIPSDNHQDLGLNNHPSNSVSSVKSVKSTGAFDKNTTNNALLTVMYTLAATNNDHAQLVKTQLEVQDQKNGTQLAFNFEQNLELFKQRQKQQHPHNDQNSDQGGFDIASLQHNPVNSSNSTLQTIQEVYQDNNNNHSSLNLVSNVEQEELSLTKDDGQTINHTKTDSMDPHHMHEMQQQFQKLTIQKENAMNFYETDQYEKPDNFDEQSTHVPSSFQETLPSEVNLSPAQL